MGLKRFRFRSRTKGRSSSSAFTADLFVLDEAGRRHFTADLRILDEAMILCEPGRSAKTGFDVQRLGFHPPFDRPKAP